MWFRLLVLALCLLACGATRAVDWIEPGERIELDADEGLGLILIDSDSAISELVLDRDGGVFDAHIPRLAEGRYLRLVKLRAGNYRFSRIRLFSGRGGYWSWKFPKALSEAIFTIEAGKTNYIGDLISRGLDQRALGIDNRSANAVIEIQASFPEVIERFPWRYAGEYPDPFVAYHLRAVAAGTTGTNAGSAPIPATTTQERDLASLFFRAPEVGSVTLSPSGRYLVESRLEGNQHKTVVVRTADLREQVVYTGSHPHFDLEWVDPQRLVLTISDSAGSLASHLVTLPDGTGPIKAEVFAAKGFVLSVADSSEEVLFLATEFRGGTRLFKQTLSRLISARPFRRAERIGHDLGDAWWWSDPSGTARLAKFVKKESTRYRYLRSDGHVEFSLSDEPNVFENVAGFDRAGRLLIVSNRDRAQRELVYFDPVKGSLGATAFSRAGSDVQGVLYGPRHVVTGVQLLSKGRLSSVPLENPDAALYASISKALPEHNLAVFGASDSGHRLVFGSTSRDPGTYFLYHNTKRTLEPISRPLPGLLGREMAVSRRIETQSTDGFTIESFLTIDSSGRRKDDRLPLLVMIHGGPIGVFDMASFDPEVQYFAQLGYAVLQVNYRGSGNRGSAEHLLGLGEFGKGIESDIDRAVDHALSVASIDANRIVAYGASYGGYSALMLTALKPERYRAAVSIAGATDLLLRFSSGDIAFEKRALSMIKHWMGDPLIEHEQSRLMSISPVYRYKDLNRPILLVHDRNDPRVTFEHSRRLQMLLRTRDKPAAFIATDDGHHGVVDPVSQQSVYPQIAAFLRGSLRGPL